MLTSKPTFILRWNGCVYKDRGWSEVVACLVVYSSKAIIKRRGNRIMGVSKEDNRSKINYWTVKVLQIS